MLKPRLANRLGIRQVKQVIKGCRKRTVYIGLEACERACCDEQMEAILHDWNTQLVQEISEADASY